MPHRCTRCETVFKDGTAVILNGCPNCGWNKFLYVREYQEEKNKAQEPIKPEETLQRTEKTDSESERVESVRILSQGSYELNLESLLEREEIIMALKENGTYVVHLPSIFQKKKH